MAEQTLLTFEEAAKWASEYLNKKVSVSNISYLVQYGRVQKYSENGIVKIKVDELKEYYDNNVVTKRETFKKELGEDLNWALSFDKFSEKDTTKHVHRLHPYKGKFIPQLVEYFLDSHTDEFKTEVFFSPGDIILDPFMGSGTTLVQAAELGIHSIGIDISKFNCMIADVKMNDYQIRKLANILKDALQKTRLFSEENFDDIFDNKLRELISDFNSRYFQNPDYRMKINSGEVEEEKYSKEKFGLFWNEYQAFKNEYNSSIISSKDSQEKLQLFLFEEGIRNRKSKEFIDTWFTERVRGEMYFYLDLIGEVSDEKIQQIMKIILSRTARSCRATTHYELANLKEPQYSPYYCYKHKKICTPTNSIVNSTFSHLKRYTNDTIKRIQEYSKLKKDVDYAILNGDSRTIDIEYEVKNQFPKFYNKLKAKKIDGVFTSPPYVGQINYHAQHAYAYELFGIERRDEQEIGAKFLGKGQNARKDYVKGISDVFNNIKSQLKSNAFFFIVANDKYNLYPEIAKRSGLEIINRFKRPVLNRTSRDRNPYSETVFYMVNRLTIDD